MLMRMKDNYYIKKCYGDFVLLKSKKNQEKCKKVLERVGVYGTLKETKEAIIKEMIKDEVNHRKTEPLYKLIPLMRQMYNRFYEENMECCFVGQSGRTCLCWHIRIINNRKNRRFMECLLFFRYIDSFISIVSCICTEEIKSDKYFQKNIKTL